MTRSRFTRVFVKARAKGAAYGTDSEVRLRARAIASFARVTPSRVWNSASSPSSLTPLVITFRALFTRRSSWRDSSTVAESRALSATRIAHVLRRGLGSEKELMGGELAVGKVGVDRSGERRVHPRKG